MLQYSPMPRRLTRLPSMPHAAATADPGTGDPGTGKPGDDSSEAAPAPLPPSAPPADDAVQVAPATPRVEAAAPSEPRVRVEAAAPVQAMAPVQVTTESAQVRAPVGVPLRSLVAGEYMAGLVDALEVRLRASSLDGRDVRMTLHPDDLGEVTVRLRVQDGVAIAMLAADRPEAGALLAGAADELRAALADRGLELERLEVTTGGSERRAGSEQGRAGRETQRETVYAFQAERDAPGPHQQDDDQRDGLWLLA